jgi:LAO/AO transport system kinase
MVDSAALDAFIKKPNSIDVKNHQSIAKLISGLEAGYSIPNQFFKDYANLNVGCITVGITGGAGAGKSTFINKLTSCIINGDYSVAIILIDPASKLTKGTFLGDRIRISPDHLEKNVYIRSISTLESASNIPVHIESVVRCMRIIGFDFILIETDIYFINKNDIQDSNQIKIAMEDYLELNARQRTKFPEIIVGNSRYGDGVLEVYNHLVKNHIRGS